MKTFFKTDPHSYYQDGDPKIQHLDWNIQSVDFETRRLICTVELTFDKGGVTRLDTRDLRIWNVRDEHDHMLPFTLERKDLNLGSELRFTVRNASLKVRIQYEVNANASGLQWLTPGQTADKTHPYLFSQGEEIHARSYIPCQDTPGVRFTFTVAITVSHDMRGIVACNRFVHRIVEGEFAHEKWAMDYPVPAYLLAIAVGNLVSADISDRSRVWSEPSMVKRAAEEFSDLPKIMKVGERLFGPYPWERSDILVLPPSFPYGGMENPCLMYLSPSLVTGDKSMITTVAHEQAHSWTGNLVTNASWRDFWLNEGWTVYAELRIVEELYGKDEAMLRLKLLERECARDFERFYKTRPLFTSLAPDLSGIDPDDAFSRIPYFKGAMFLIALEEAVGREEFDQFIHKYIETFRFQSITTSQFLDFVSVELTGVFDLVGAWEWVYEAGMPDNAPEISSPLITTVEQYVLQVVPPLEAGKNWSASQWILFLEMLPRPSLVEFASALRSTFRLDKSKNTEIRWAYLLLALESGSPMFSEAEEFLLTQGRLKYIKPLYKALHTLAPERAQAIFKKARSGYHPIAVGQVTQILEGKQ